jgi:hypothetical protein
VNDDVLPIQIRRCKVFWLEVDRPGPWCYIRAAARLGSDICGWRHNLFVEPLVVIGGNERLSELGQVGVQPATNGVLGPLFAMEDPAEVDLM